jgi:hypothetical protein
MTNSLIAHHRLSNHLIGGAAFDKAGDVVRWMGLVQAQDYLGALWAVGLRMPGATEAGVEQAIADREIVRTWPARGTLHFVSAADVRWMLDLLAPRVIARTQARYRQLGLDDAVFAHSRRVVIETLRGGQRLSRTAMYRVLESAQISPEGQRGIHILSRLAQEGLICLGPRDGKQPTFTLLEEWIPAATTRPRDEALAELARRYFTSHGPATLRDFVWWSGLTASDARFGLELARPHLVPEVIDEQTYWLLASLPPGAQVSQTVHLLPAFDEYLVGYRDRRAVLNPVYGKQTNAGGGMLSPTILVNGQVTGTWSRSLKRGSVALTPNWFAEPNGAEEQALAAAASRYGAFLGLSSVQLQTSPRHEAVRLPREPT